MKQIIAYIKREEWSPYMAGSLLGLVAILIAVTSTVSRDPAIALGALGAISSRTWKLRWMPDKQWAEAFGQSRVTRWVLVFLGAILLEYGAGMVGGCTSGLAIWGGLQLAPAAFVFMGGMFATGIVTALIVYRRKY